jgi:hypothetical protein
MPERASLNQVTQIGVEVTPGTPVAATRRLQSLSIEPSVNVDIDQFRAAGSKYRSLTSMIKEWTVGSLSGRATYNEMVYALSSVVNTAVITTPGGGTNSRKWTFTSSTTADDNPKVYTIEHGAGGAATNNGRFAYGLFTEFSISWSRNGPLEIGGSVFGRKYTPNFGVMAAATTIDPIPIQPTEVTIYMDPDRTLTQANDPTTKLSRVISGEFSIGGRFGPVWVVDAANPAHVAHVETEPDVTLTLTAQADAEGLAILSGMAQTGATEFIRVRATGATIEGAIPYEFVIDFAAKVADVGDFGDEDGVYAIEVTFVAVHNSDWGKAYELYLVNTLTGL